MKNRDRDSSSLAIYFFSAVFSFSLWIFYFANVVYASDCPPNDPSRVDCANAAQTANNPATPASGTVAGTGTSLVVDRLRRRRPRPKPATKPPKDYGPGKTNVWDPSEEEQQHKWEKEGLVWDPQELTWRPPRAGEIPPPPDAPENPPPYAQQHPRDKVPPDCLNDYDDYVLVQSRLIALEADIKFASEAQWDAQFKLNQLLAKFSLKFGYDLADTVILAKAVAELTVHLGAAMMNLLPRTLAEALETAQGVFRRASAKASDLAKELSEALGIAGRKAKVAEEAAQAAKSLRGVADDAAKLLTEADEVAKAAKSAVQEAEEALAAATNQVDKLKAEKVLLEAQKAVAEGQVKLKELWEQAYIEYLRNKPGAGLGGPLYQVKFDLEMLTHDIGSVKFDISNLRKLPTPTPAQVQELANLEGKLAGMYTQANSLNKVMTDATKAFYGVDDVSQLTEGFMEQHLNNHLRKLMGDEAFTRASTTPNEAWVNAANTVKEIEGKLSGVAKELDPLLQESQKAGTKVANLAEQANKAQTAANKIMPEAAEKASKAVEAESNAASASSDAAQAQDTVSKTQSNLNGANQEVTTAQSALGTADAAAQSYVKNHFAESPAEVAKVLIGARDDVKRIVEKLKELQNENDELLKALKELKPKLDDCLNPALHPERSP